jgi:hypothetical protein
VLKQAQEWYDRCWDDWFSQRTPANEQRLELATAKLEEAKYHVKSNAEAKAAWQQKLQAEKDAKRAESDARYVL